MSDDEASAGVGNFDPVWLNDRSEWLKVGEGSFGFVWKARIK